MNVYTKLNKKEYSYIWDEFEKRFSFTPSIRPELWPGIREPKGSIVFSLVRAMDADTNNDTLEDIFYPVFESLSDIHKMKYILDWQHESYKVDSFSSKELYPLGVFPDGDYIIWLNKSLSNGTFGHPWEQTLCVFGDELVSRTKDRLIKLLGSPVRNN